MRKLATIIAALALSYFLSAMQVQAQMTAPVSASGTAQITEKVVGIDYNSREITLQDAKGNTNSFQVSPAVKRFDQIKVGDTITFTYQESVALNMVKADAMAAPPPSSSPIVTSLGGDKPAGQVSQTQVAVVTIQAIDMSKPSVTVKTNDGRVLDLAVQNKDILSKFKVGDVVQITYSQALMIAVK